MNEFCSIHEWIPPTPDWWRSQDCISSSFFPVKLSPMPNTAVPGKHMLWKLRLHADACWWLFFISCTCFCRYHLSYLVSSYWDHLICEELCHVSFVLDFSVTDFVIIMLSSDDSQLYESYETWAEWLNAFMLGTFLLRWYCAYVLLSAMNGVTEGFKNATMSDSQVNR